MTGADPTDPDEPERADGEGPGRAGRPWVRPALIGVGVVLAGAGIGFGIGVAARPADPEPAPSEREAFAAARREVGREMARRGFAAGVRDGRTHGIIAGGMAAESDATILIREQRAGEAQAEAASAQAELAGMTAAPSPPAVDEGE